MKSKKGKGRLQGKIKRLKQVGVSGMLKLARRRKNKHVAITQPVIRYIDDLSSQTFSDRMIGMWRESESFPMSSMQIDLTEAAFLRLLVQISGAKRILEVGTFRGWSTAVLASALCTDSTTQGDLANIKVTTIQLREEEAEQARILWKKHLDPVTLGTIDMVMGNARIVMKDMVAKNVARDSGNATAPANLFDLIFIDADKSGYIEYLDHAKRLIRKGGLIVLDNMLNAGLVAGKASDNTTRALKRVNETVFSAEMQADGFTPIIIPAWDGVVVLRKN